MKPHLLLFLCLLPFVGCGAATDLSSKLVGEWQGRPETASERLLREWPTDEKPTEEEASEQATKTDIESLEPIQISMRLDQNSSVELSIEGAPAAVGVESLSGKWLYQPTNTTQGMLEIAIESDDSNSDAKSDASINASINDSEEEPVEANSSFGTKDKKTIIERRRFLIELIVEKNADEDRFLLVEEGADPRFGRLLFERKAS